MAAPSYQSFAEAKVPTAQSTITIDKPTGTVENDLLVAFISQGFANENNPMTPPGGWTELFSGLYGGCQMGCFYKVAGDSEPSDYTFTHEQWSQRAYGFIIRVSDVNTSSPINIYDDNWGEHIYGNPWARCPNVTTTKDECLILRLFAADYIYITEDGGYPAEHTGITVDKSGTGESDCSGGAAWAVQETVGATGTADFIMTELEQWITLTIAIEPAAGITIVEPSTFALALTQQTSSVAVSITVFPATFELALTQHAPDVVIDITVTPVTLELALALQTPTVEIAVVITPDAFELEVDIPPPTVLFPLQTILPDTFELALQQELPQIVYPAQTMLPDTQELALALHAPEVATAAVVEPATLELALTQHAPVVSIDCTVIPGVFELVLTLHAPTIMIAGDVTVFPDMLQLALTPWTPGIFTRFTEIPPFMHKDLIDPYSGGAWLWLAEISIPTQSTVRIARNTADVVYGGVTFTKANFDVGKQSLSGDASIPQIVLRVAQDEARTLEDIVNATKGGENGTVKLIRTCEKFLESPVADLEADYDILSAGSVFQWVTFVLGIPNPLMQRFPLWLYSSKVCPLATPSLFKGPRCQYPGDDTVCTGLLGDCRTKGNAAHWGAEIGLDPNAVRV